MKKMVIFKRLFLFSCIIFIFHVTTGDCFGRTRIVENDEAEFVKGGAIIARIFGFGNSSVAVQPSTNIRLGNIQYVSQYMAPNTVQNYRDISFCGIASAMMVRTKNYANAQSNLNIPRQRIENDMITIDNNLQNKTYGETINVHPNGLVYMSIWGELPNVQFNKTYNVLRSLYTYKNGDRVINDSGHVSSIWVRVLPVQYNEATNEIFSHVKNSNQPVVIIIDSNIQSLVARGSYVNINRSDPPTLHYNVVIGVKEEYNQKTFLVYDPALGSTPRDYSAGQLETLI